MSLLLLIALFGQAEANDPAGLSTVVRRLVRDLDANEVSRRDGAEQKLIELGPQVIEHFPPITERTSAAVRQSLERIRRTLERGEAEANLQASTVTLPRQKLRLSQVLAAIEKQTGNKLVDLRTMRGGEAPDPEISVDFNQTPFWEALDKVLDQARMTVYPFSGDKGLGLTTRADNERGRGNAQYSGPFRIEAASVVARRDFRRGHTALDVKLELAWEPRLAPIVVTAPIGKLGAVAAGERIPPRAAEAGTIETSPVRGTYALEMLLPLELPGRSVETIASLKGQFAVLVPGKVETFTFDKLADAKDVRQHKAQATVTLDKVLKNRDVWEVHMRLRFDKAAGALDSHRGWMFNNEAYLVGPQQERVETAGWETTRNTRDEIGIAYFFSLPKGPEGYSFVYKTPAAMLETVVDFELKDLELP